MAKASVASLGGEGGGLVAAGQFADGALSVDLGLPETGEGLHYGPAAVPLVGAVAEVGRIYSGPLFLVIFSRRIVARRRRSLIAKGDFSLFAASWALLASQVSRKSPDLSCSSDEVVVGEGFEPKKRVFSAFPVVACNGVFMPGKILA